MELPKLQSEYEGTCFISAILSKHIQKPLIYDDKEDISEYMQIYKFLSFVIVKYEKQLSILVQRIITESISLIID